MPLSMNCCPVTTAITPTSIEVKRRIIAVAAKFRFSLYTGNNHLVNSF